jgi:serine/threonine protein kinase
MLPISPERKAAPLSPKNVITPSPGRSNATLQAARGALKRVNQVEDDHFRVKRKPFNAELLKKLASEDSTQPVIINENRTAAEESKQPALCNESIVCPPSRFKVPPSGFDLDAIKKVIRATLGNDHRYQDSLLQEIVIRVAEAVSVRKPFQNLPRESTVTGVKFPKIQLVSDPDLQRTIACVKLIGSPLGGAGKKFSKALIINVENDRVTNYRAGARLSSKDRPELMQREIEAHRALQTATFADGDQQWLPIPEIFAVTPLYLGKTGSKKVVAFADLCNLGDLLEFRKKFGKATKAQLVPIFSDIVKGLEYLATHPQGSYFDLDRKPGNYFVKQEGSTYRVLTGDLGSLVKDGQLQRVAETPFYMSPESFIFRHADNRDAQPEPLTRLQLRITPKSAVFSAALSMLIFTDGKQPNVQNLCQLRFPPRFCFRGIIASAPSTSPLSTTVQEVIGLMNKASECVAGLKAALLTPLRPQGVVFDPKDQVLLEADWIIFTHTFARFFEMAEKLQLIPYELKAAYANLQKAIAKKVAEVYEVMDHYSSLFDPDTDYFGYVFSRMLLTDPEERISCEELVKTVVPKLEQIYGKEYFTVS